MLLLMVQFLQIQYKFKFCAAFRAVLGGDLTAVGANDGSADGKADACIAALNKFLPYVDNWATCDMMSPKVLKKDLPRLYEWVKIWIVSGKIYTIRFGVNMLMKYFLDEAFTAEYPELVASVRSAEYYVKMVVAWYFATALAKQYEAVLPYLTECRLDTWTHNKTIQKAVESYRITTEQKEFLRMLKIK